MSMMFRNAGAAMGFGKRASVLMSRTLSFGSFAPTPGVTKDLCRSIESAESTDSVIQELAADIDAEPREVERRRRCLSCRYVMYVFGCLVVTIGFGVLSVGLWSEMGSGTYYLEILQRNQHLGLYCGSLMLAIVLLLYLLDFFVPVHLPGRYLVLTDGNGCLGRFCLSLAVIAFVAWLFLMADDFPTLPIVLTNLFCPMSVVLLRRVTMPVVPERPASFSGARSLEDRIALIKLLTWEERDEANFYTAAMYAFSAAGALVIGVWVQWALANETEFAAKLARSEDEGERELLFARWAAPLFVATSDLVFAGFAGLRVTQNGAYSATDQIKNQLIFNMKSSGQRQVMQYRIAMLRARAAAAQNQRDLLRTTEDKLQKYLVQHISHMRRLSKIVKSAGGTIIALILALHIVFQMTTAVNHIAVMVQGFLASYLLTFAVFIFVSFNRVSRSLSLELMDLPLLKSLSGCRDATWARALLLCLGLPLAPLILAVSWLNQIVRRARGLSRSPSLLTERVEKASRQVLAWEWVEVVGWCYILAGVLMIFRMSPILLNVLLAWMSFTFAPLGFWTICTATFATGVFLFMLPPVPGPIIYPFAGIVISDPEKCPYGFWWGCAISVILSFVMKMTACFVQQKVIGEMLGSSTAIKRAVGIHKPAIRAIEAVLRQPGMSFGKCMILCGGPDWPTSVLAGILRLSVWQCLLGTCPILLSIVPMALTGSFYLKRDESEVWTRTGNLMLALTTVVSAVFLAGIGWAIQDEYDKRGGELTKPRKEFLELEWLDHRAEQVAQSCRVTWAVVPRGVRLAYGLGALLAILVGQLFLWATSRCFGAFTLTDDIQALVWFWWAGDGLVRPLGLAGLVCGAVSYIGLLQYKIWYRGWSRAPRAEAESRLAEEEASWKRAWLEDLHQGCASRHSSCEGLEIVPSLLSARSFGQTVDQEKGIVVQAGGAGCECSEGRGTAERAESVADGATMDAIASVEVTSAGSDVLLSL